MTSSMQNNAQTVQFSSVPQYNDFIDFDSERCFYPYGKIWSHTPGEDFTFLHRHNFIEAGVLLSGAGVFNIDGNVFPVKAPAVSIIYPGQLHSAQSSPFSPSVWNFLYFDPILAMPDISAAKIKNLRFNNLRKYDVDNVLPFRDAPAVFYAIKSAIDCIGEKTPNREYAEGCLFAALSAWRKEWFQCPPEIPYPASHPLHPIRHSTPFPFLTYGGAYDPLPVRECR